MNYKNLNDYDLVSLIKDSDRTAFTVIYHRYIRGLYTLCMRYIKDHDASKDILQNTFEKLWIIRKELIPSMSIKNYLYTMTRNAVLNYIRDYNNAIQHNYKIAQRQRRIEDDIYLQADREGEINELFDAIEKLPEQQKRVAKYRCEGFSNREIARMMGLSLNTINTHYRESLKNLRKQLTYIIGLVTILIINIWNL